jgi:leucyl-tRNA synthetase
MPDPRPSQPLAQPTGLSAASEFPHRYTAALAGSIESRWQREWAERGAFRAPNPGDPGFDASRPKYYCLDMFPYPSGDGLHVGHPEGYTATDIISRYKRMKGFNVLHPMGWDAFGLPAEQYAVRTGVHPAITTRKAIDTFRGQLQRFGFSYDWSREIATIDPDYYRWTQWVFLQIYDSWYDKERGTARRIAELEEILREGVYGINPEGELVPMAGRPGGPGGPPLAIAGEPVGVRLWHELSQEERRAFLDSQRLAYLGEQTVNWCPDLGTVLANEEVVNGRSERGGYPVFRKSLRQWMFRITAYAERLLDDLKTIDWPESTRTQQAEWIGRSEGAEIDFPLADADRLEGSIRVYTTRPDTLFGATFMALAPEHPIVSSVLDAPPAGADAAAIRSYIAAARNRSDVERQAEGKDKSGVFSGLYAINPATGAQIPVWIADYVLMGYGHGAIMAVPAHDERDYEFARKFGLPVREVVRAFEEEFPESFRNFISRYRFHPRFDIALWFKPEQAAESAPLIQKLRTRTPLPEGSTVAIVQDAPDGGVYIAAPHGLVLDNPGLKQAQGYMLSSCTSFPGVAANSTSDSLSIDGLATAEAKAAVITWLEQTGAGRRKVNYKLRDWLFSRQRYWGEPFPIVYDDRGNHYPVSDAALPVRLPEMDQYKPVKSEDPAPMLAGAPREWTHTTAGAAGVDPRVLPPQTPVHRELNTMPNWAGSCWYYLRYCDPRNATRFIGAEAERYWMDGTGVDLYIGGSEHAVLHLLYARFWHKALYDLGYLSTPEPMRKLFHQGLITSFAYEDSTGRTVPLDEVEERDGGFVLRATGERVNQITAKMSKTLKNVVNPDDVIREFGADTMRLYEMYMGPLDASKPWNPRDITGLFRFLQRAWRLVIDEDTGAPRAAPAADERIERELHRATASLGPRIEALAFNTAIADLIKFVNAVPSGAALTGAQASRFALLLAPFAPHIAEELWSRLGNTGLAMLQSWPDYDEAMLRETELELPVQVNGKVRARVVVPSAADPSALEAAALADPRVVESLGGKPVKKVIVIPGKMINIVVGP